jgi:hypothetical protein
MGYQNGKSESVNVFRVTNPYSDMSIDWSQNERTIREVQVYTHY